MILPRGDLSFFDELDSTQNMARSRLAAGELPGVIGALHQTDGRGRRARSWHSRSGDSLCLSLVFDAYANHREPWLIGMSLATAIAQFVSAKLQWPNDLLIEGKKVAGILTEVFSSPTLGDVPVVGVGINLNQTEFESEIAERATSLRMYDGVIREPKSLIEPLLEAILAAPEPTSWSSIAPVWEPLDSTKGKRYELVTGERAVAERIGPNGELICTVDGQQHRVLAADLIWEN